MSSLSSSGTINETLQQIQAVKYVYVAGAMVLVFDYLLMIDHEVKYIWKLKWSVGGMLFLLVRYPAIISTISSLYSIKATSKQCLVMYWFSAWSNLFCQFASELTLVLRTYALWKGDNRLLTFLLAHVTISFIACCTVLTLYLLPLHFEFSPLPAPIGCVVTHDTSGRVLLAVYIIITFFETTVFGLTVYMGLKTFRHSKNPLLITAYRDGILYFLFLFFFTIGNTIVLTTLQGTLTQALISPHLAMHSVLSARILLHLRDVSRTQPYHVTLWPFNFTLGRRHDPQDVGLERVVISTTRGRRTRFISVKAVGA